MNPGAAGCKHIPAAGHEELLDVTIGQRRLLAAVRHRNSTEGPIGQQEVEHATRGVHDDVQHTAFGFKIIHIDNRRVVVGIEKQELGVRSHIKHAGVGVHVRSVEHKIVGRERYQGVGGCEDFDDHLGDFSIRREIPSCTGIAVGVESARVGAARGERARFAKHAQTSPVKQRGAHAVDDQLRLFDGHPVLAAGSDFKGHVG